jgi:hypothetical protein
MCAVLEVNRNVLRPGRIVGCHVGKNVLHLPWAGFAQAEKLAWWRRTTGGELADVPAHRFAERSDRTRNLAWEPVPAGFVVRALVIPNDGKPLLKIVTRASTPDELARYEHDRMPLIELPLFSGEIIPVERDAQGELF